MLLVLLLLLLPLTRFPPHPILKMHTIISIQNPQARRLINLKGIAGTVLERT